MGPVAPGREADTAWGSPLCNGRQQRAEWRNGQDGSQPLTPQPQPASEGKPQAGCAVSGKHPASLRPEASVHVAFEVDAPDLGAQVHRPGNDPSLENTVSATNSLEADRDERRPSGRPSEDPLPGRLHMVTKALTCDPGRVEPRVRGSAQQLDQCDP